MDLQVPSTSSSSFQIAHLISTDSIISGFVFRASQCAWLFLMLGGETVNHISGGFFKQTRTLSVNTFLSEQWAFVSVNVLPAGAALSCSYAITSFCTLLRIHITNTHRFQVVFLCPESPNPWAAVVALCLSRFPFHLLFFLSAALCWDPRQLSRHVGTGLLFGEVSVFVRWLRCYIWTWSPGRGGVPGCQCGHGQDVQEQNPPTSHPSLGPSGLWELAEAPHSCRLQPIFWLLLLRGAQKSLDQLRHPLSSTRRCTSEPSRPLPRRGHHVWRGRGVPGAGWRSGNKSQRD